MVETYNRDKLFKQGKNESFGTDVIPHKEVK
jgi:hypothetical protein